MEGGGNDGGGITIAALTAEVGNLRDQVQNLILLSEARRTSYEELHGTHEEMVERKLTRRTKLWWKFGLAIVAVFCGVLVFGSDFRALMFDIKAEMAEENHKLSSELLRASLIYWSMGSMVCSGISLLVITAAGMLEVFMRPRSIPWKALMDFLIVGLAFGTATVMFLGKSDVIDEGSEFMKYFNEGNKIVRIGYVCASMSFLSLTHMFGNCLHIWGLIAENYRDLAQLG